MTALKFIDLFAGIGGFRMADRGRTSGGVWEMKLWEQGNGQMFFKE
jgi:hypothetical protein